MVYKGATDYIELIFVQKGKKKKKKESPKTPRDKRQGRDKKVRYKRAGRNQDNRLASYIHKIKGEKSKIDERAFKSISPQPR